MLVLWWFAQTTLIAAALALVAALACRWRRPRLGPEARCALWLIVLVKFATPPVVAWPWGVPDSWPAARTSEIPAPPKPVEVASSLPTVEVDSSASPLPPGEGPGARDDAGPSGPEAALDRDGLDRDPLDGPRPSPPAPLPEGEGSEIPAPPPEDLPDDPPPIEEILRAPAEPAPIPPPTPTIEAPDPPAPIAVAPVPEPVPVAAPVAARPRPFGWPTALLALWLAGSAVVLARRGVAIVRFGRTLRRARPAPAWLVAEARAVGERLGVAVPPMAMAPGVGTPLLWCLGRPRLVVPEGLVDRLPADRWAGILAHELAHLARLDHWVVRLELLAELAWWWNPLFHHARNRLHVEAEQACDARVVRSLPDRRFAYAEALVDVCEHLSRPAIPSPALGVGGAGGTGSRILETRLLMILRDPIPDRPSRRSALAFALLGALALPAWTLGQQPADKPEAPKADQPKVEAKADAPKAGEAKPADQPKAEARPAEAPKAEPAELPDIADLQKEFEIRRKKFTRLALRYVVASRAEAISGQRHRRRVQVEAADVVYEFQRNQNFADPFIASRFDAIEAMPGWSEAAPGGAPWARRLEIRTGTEIKAVQVESSNRGPAPFSWRSLASFQQGGSTSLGEYFKRDSLFIARGDEPFGVINPSRARPASALDIDRTGPGYFPMTNYLGRSSVAGSEEMSGPVYVQDSEKAVRVAWIGQDGQTRAIAWVVPALDYAIVRVEAFVDGPRENDRPEIRWIWRKGAEDFKKVDGLWLPGKVTLRISEIDPEGQSRDVREQVVLLENIKVNAELPDDAFEAEFPVRGIDPKTGNFTTVPPSPSPDLLARLARAVRESPFGPPSDETTTDPDRAGNPGNPKPGLFNRPATPARPGGVTQVIDPTGPNPAPTANVPNPGAKPNTYADSELVPFGKTYGRADGQTQRAKANTPAASKPADPTRKADDEVEIPPPFAAQARKEVAAGQKPADPARVEAPGDRDRAEDQDRAITRRFFADPEVLAIAEQMMAAREKFREIARITSGPDDPAMIKAKQAKEKLERKYQALWENKTREFREEIQGGREQVKDALKLAEIRRERQAALVARAQARKDLASGVVDRYSSMSKKVFNSISQEEMAKAEGESAIADAELQAQKADLKEADLAVEQAKRAVDALALAMAGREGKPEDAPDLGKAPAATRGSNLPDLRDEVELLGVQIEGKQNELKSAEARSALARRQFERNKVDHDRGALRAEVFEKAEAELQAAEAAVESKRLELAEAQLRLKQAKRRVEAETARLKREAERLKERLDWSRQMNAKGLVSKATFAADQMAYDNVMSQLDPDDKPVPAPSDPKDGAQNP